MAAERPPYLNAYGNITKALQRIKTAHTPPRFTQDFLGTTLDLKGGSATPLIPFLKRTGFLGGDGVPTELYKRFRNPSKAGVAAAEALRTGYLSLYEVNEYIHNANDKELLGVVVQVTGLEPKSGVVKAIVSSFKAVKAFASFDGIPDDADEEEVDAGEGAAGGAIEHDSARPRALGLSYTINLNLPATSDIKVFDAIFKSLKDHLLR